MQLQADTHAHCKFLQGMRGLASLVVYVEHFSGPQFRGLAYAYGSPGNFSVWQFPVVRLIAAGSPMVSIFFVVSGYTLSIHYAKLTAAGRIDAAMRSISGKALRRGMRLFGPSIIASIVIAVLLVAGVYGCNCHWLDDGSSIVPTRLDSSWMQFLDLLNWIGTAVLFPSTWLGKLPFATSNEYSLQLWTIPVEFYSSMALFSAQIALVECNPPLRIASLAAMGSFALLCSQWQIFCFFTGAAFAEVDELQLATTKLDTGPINRVYSAIPESVRSAEPIIYPVLLVIGLVLASFPDALGSETPGYRILTILTSSERIWQSLGAALCVHGASRQPSIRALLETKAMIFLGRISYGLYLVHIPMLGLLGWRVVPALRTLTAASTLQSERAGVAVAFLFITTMTIAVAYAWTVYVDEPLVRAAKRTTSRGPGSCVTVRMGINLVEPLVRV